ncbi:hypothetical protein NKJ23_26285 [Mesorhizobium sp. M0184]|uniref:hypothetical protein n=1 Tax=Mesorhizobium sp. M0184 TaxID=2956906 RepID=UPI0033386628
MPEAVPCEESRGRKLIAHGAEILGGEFNMMPVDFYEDGGEPVFGEFTIYPAAASCSSMRRPSIANWAPTGYPFHQAALRGWDKATLVAAGRLGLNKTSFAGAIGEAPRGQRSYRPIVTPVSLCP